MKKIKYLLFMMMLLIPNGTVFAQSIDDYTKSSMHQLGYVPYNDVTSAIVVDVKTGDVYFSYQADKQVDPASITKLMTAYVIYEAIANNEVSWDTKVKATANDEAISQLVELSNTPIIDGVEYTLKELMYMHLMESSNVASIMMANLVSKNNLSDFVKRMNDTAQKLNLDHTVYTNPSGAITVDFSGLITISDYSMTQPSYSTAEDVAKLSVALLKQFPEVIHITQLTTATIGEYSGHQQILKSTNLSLPGMPLGHEGVNGLKTGTSGESGYSFVGSVKRADRQLVVVVLGVGTYENVSGNLDRFYYVNALIDQTYQKYTEKEVLKTGNYMVDDTEIRVTQPYKTVVSDDTPPLNYHLEGDTLIIERPFINIYGQKTDTLQIVNETRLKQEEAQQKQRRLQLIVLSVVVFVVAGTLLWQKVNQKKSNHKR